MAYGKRAQFETLRSLGFAGIGAAYAAIGAAVAGYPRIITVFNTTDKEVYLSIDGVTNQISQPPGTGQVIDFTANKVRDDGFMLDRGLIFYAKQGDAGAPTSGKVTVQIVVAGGGI